MTALAILSAQVLTDADLFRCIAAFQRGLTMPLYAFWRAHKPYDASLRLAPDTATMLVQALITHGTPELFDMATRATFCSVRIDWRRVTMYVLETLSLSQVADLALQQNRADIVEWALASKNSSLRKTQRAWRTEIDRFTDDDDTRMLQVLKMYAPIPVSELNVVVQNVSIDINSARLLHWLTEQIPGVSIPVDMVEIAVRFGRLPVLQFLHAYGYTTCDRATFRSAFSARRPDVLGFLLDHYADSLDESSAQQLALDSDPAVQQLAVRFAESLRAGCATRINASGHTNVTS